MNTAFKGEVSMTQLKNTTVNLLDESFGHLKYVLVIYPPLQGGHRQLDIGQIIISRVLCLTILFRKHFEIRYA